MGSMVSARPKTGRLNQILMVNGWLVGGIECVKSPVWRGPKKDGWTGGHLSLSFGATHVGSRFFVVYLFVTDFLV